MPATDESRVTEDISKLGVIAGGGSLPERLLYACDQAGIEPFVVGFEGQTQPHIFDGRHYLLTRLGAAGRIINTLKAHNIRDLVLIGDIHRPTLADLKPDWRTIRFFTRAGMQSLGDDGLLKALRAELEEEGFSVHGVQDFVADILTGHGQIGHYKPKRADWEDIHRGVAVALKLGTLDVGQSVIVQEGLVLGIEAIEGTDELIRRCKPYKRKGRGGVLVKLAKPGQDPDLDLPTIGPRTVELCAESELSGIAVQAEQSLLIEPQAVAEKADSAKMFVFGLSPEDMAAAHDQN